MKSVHVVVMAMVGAVALGCGGEGDAATSEPAGEALTTSFGMVSAKSDITSEGVIRTGMFSTHGVTRFAGMQWTPDSVANQN